MIIIYNLNTFHDVARRAAESDRQLQFRSDESNKLREEVESLLKYKQNHRQRNVNRTWILHSHLMTMMEYMLICPKH